MKYFFLLIHICFVNYTFSQQVKSSVGKVNSTKENNPTPVSKEQWNVIDPNAICGVNLAYKSIDRNEIEITLTKYFYCTDIKLDSIENVTLIESSLNSTTDKPVLKLISVKDTSRLVNVSCVGYRNSCVKTAVYSGQAKIMSPKMGGYDITWGYCCWDENAMTNIEGMMEFKKQGLSLIVHIPELPPSEMNSSPVFHEAPVLATCKKQLIVVNSGATDPDRDSLSYELGTIYDYLTVNGLQYEDQPNTMPGKPTNKTFAGGKPPFKKITYKKGITAKKPMGGKQFDLNFKTGEMQIKADTIGDFLVAVNVNEFRKQKLLSTHQMIYKIKVVD